MEKQKAPGYLEPLTAKWWEEVNSEYELEPHHVRLLTLAASAWDRCEQARQLLLEKGLTYTDRFDQPKKRPEVSIEQDSRIAFARLIRELNLDIEPPKAPGRPPALY